MSDRLDPSSFTKAFVPLAVLFDTFENVRPRKRWGVQRCGMIVEIYFAVVKRRQYVVDLLRIDDSFTSPIFQYL